MLNKDIFNKFDKLVKKYELDDALLNDLASAICTADMLFGTNEKQLDINRFIASTDGRFGGVGVIVPKQPLPDVQVLRVLCDILILGIGSKDLKAIKDVSLANPSSDRVAKAMKLSLRGSSYKDEAECLKILEVLTKAIEADELNETIVYVINFIHKYDAGLDCKGLELPLKYKKVGYLNNASYVIDDISVDSFLYNLATCLVKNYSKVALARRLSISAKVDELKYRHRKEVILALESGTLTLARQGNHSLYSIISKMFHFTYSKTFVKMEGVLYLIYILSMNSALTSIDFMQDILTHNN